MTDTTLEPLLLTVAEAAERVRLSQKTIRRIIKSGELPARRFGTAVRIRPEDLEWWVNTCLPHYEV